MVSMIAISNHQLTPTEPVKGIPQFWLTALQRIDAVASVCCFPRAFALSLQRIEEHDIPVLEHLTDIKVVLNPVAGTGFTLEFFFSENEFFTDAVGGSMLSVV